jgi:hypothetical protein
MDDAYDADDDSLKQRQGAALYPVGRTLRSTFDAENHDSLGADVTALMLSLSRIPYEPCAKHRLPEELPAATPTAVAVAGEPRAAAPSLIARVRTLLLG